MANLTKIQRQTLYQKYWDSQKKRYGYIITPIQRLKFFHVAYIRFEIENNLWWAKHKGL